MLKLLLPALCLTLAASPAPAADEALPSKEDKMVCKRIGNTGWRLQGSRVCKTAAQWSEMSRQNRREQEEYGSVGGRTRCQACLRDSEVGRRGGL